MCSLPPTPPLGDVRVVSADGFVLEYLQLHVQSLEFGADVVGIHVGEGDFTHVRVAIVASKWAVCVYILSEKTHRHEHGDVSRSSHFQIGRLNGTSIIDDRDRRHTVEKMDLWTSLVIDYRYRLFERVLKISGKKSCKCVSENDSLKG